MSVQERTFKIHCKASLGELVSVEIYSKPFMGLLHNQWFCDKILIKTPGGDEILFPCYSWLDSNERLVLRPAKASLVFQDINPIAQRQRTRQLEEQQKLFRWRVYAEGMPQVIDYDTALALPAEVRFSFAKETEFKFSAGKQLAALKLTGLANSRRSWENLSQLEVILCEKVKTIEYIQEHWDEDKFFGYQFLNGLNPMMIQRCSKLPENFPVTDDMVKDSLRGSSLEQDMKRLENLYGRFMAQVLGRLAEMLKRHRMEMCRCHTSPSDCHTQSLGEGAGNAFPTLSVAKRGDPCFLRGMGVAGVRQRKAPIDHAEEAEKSSQLRQKRSKENPIFLPTDSKADWKLAKIFVRNAEFGVHEVDFHLLRTHLLAEVFTMATLRNLPPPHPLYKLLFPHIRYTLKINIMARNRLISKDGICGVGGESLAILLKRATASLTYSTLCLPDNISERGLENVPHYYYRDDGMKLWNIINKFVLAFLSHYYQFDAHVQKDRISEIFTNGFLGRDGSGIPSSLQTVTELVKFVTMVIFTASAQHATVNNGQFDFGGWMPNFPTALRKPPPKEKGQTTEDTILETLPDVSTTVNGMAVLRLLSKDSADHYPLGHFPENLYDDNLYVPCKLIEEFQKDLRELSDLIEERNNNLELPYIYLNSKNECSHLNEDIILS
ncbi:hydroperoxide isomerase ALOXE3-like [Chanodichthys erythropterus]|uniref:hydroperoxide isomerase ALOXE3-like n=1 Tax=Chanodichthys erythropterus TaxID=933992 RepID=UPI00351EE907